MERAERRRAALGPDPLESYELYSEVFDRVQAAALLESEYEHDWELDSEMIRSKTHAELDRLRLPWAEADAALDAAKDELIECRYRGRVAASEAQSAASDVRWHITIHRVDRTWTGQLEQLHAEIDRLHEENDRLHAERR